MNLPTSRCLATRKEAQIRNMPQAEVMQGCLQVRLRNIHLQPEQDVAQFCHCRSMARINTLKIIAANWVALPKSQVVALCTPRSSFRRPLPRQVLSERILHDSASQYCCHRCKHMDIPAPVPCTAASCFKYRQTQKQTERNTPRLEMVCCISSASPTQTCAIRQPFPKTESSTLANSLL